MHRFKLTRIDCDSGLTLNRASVITDAQRRGVLERIWRIVLSLQWNAAQSEKNDRDTAEGTFPMTKGGLQIHRDKK